MNEHTDLVHIFEPFGDKRTTKDNKMRNQTLTAHHYVSEEYIAAYPEVIEYDRRLHRESVMRRVTEALYEGWFPYHMEWYEGEDYTEWEYVTGLPAGKVDQNYHFHTIIHLAAPWNYVAPPRKQDGLGPSITTWHPKDLT